jgi:hypothetical protein
VHRDHGFLYRFGAGVDAMILVGAVFILCAVAVLAAWMMLRDAPPDDNNYPNDWEGWP